MINLLLCADVLLTRNLFNTILDNVHVVNLLVVNNILGNLVSSDGLVEYRGMVDQTLGEDSLVRLVIDVQLEVIIHDVLFTAHYLPDGHNFACLDSERSNVAVQHVDSVGIGCAGGFHCLVTVPQGRLLDEGTH